MLFPRTPEVAQFDALPLEALTNTMRTTLVVHDTTHLLSPLPFRTRIVRDAVHAAKFYRHERAATLLGEALAECVAEELAERHAFGTFFAPVVVPIPLHESRLRERGFNQAERIARSFTRHVSETQLRCVTDVLVRVRHTHSQAHLPKAERMQNVAGAFVVAKPDLIQGRDVILVDDVVTTGATLGAAREALLKAGAHDVLCIAVAH
jgi:ComF family protein